jgi:protein-L-isoaspartate(D-aspartate) O-methyltransferase
LDKGQIDAYQDARDWMVKHQIEHRGLRNPRLLEAMRHIPRHVFVEPMMEEMAYEDCPLPIGEGQTISQPYIVALMTSLLSLEGGENVLEIGTGSGYQAAILGRLAKTVHTIERYKSLAQRAADTLKMLNIHNVIVHVGDGSVGLPDYAPYEAIIITAAMPGVSEILLKQLAEGGRLVAPVGSSGKQILQRWEREGDHFTNEDLIPVAFVPLRGKLGWKGSDW